MEILENFKVDRKLPLLAQWLLEAERNLNDDEKDALKEFFTSVLNEESEKQDLNAEDLFEMYVLILKCKITF